MPLLPSGDSQSALSRSAVEATDIDFGDPAAASSDLGRDAPNFDQAGVSSVGLHLGNIRPETKRQRFTPWGGKRTLDNAAVWKRLKFQPWGGKRVLRKSVVPRSANSKISAFTGDSKREFHPWGGKRSA